MTRDPGPCYGRITRFLKLGALHPADGEGDEAFSSKATGHLTLAKGILYHENIKNRNDFMTSCPGDPGSILDTSRDSKETLQDHEVLRN